MVSSRGATLASAAVVLAVAGAAYGVEEFELVAFSVALLAVIAIVLVWSRGSKARRSLEIGLRVPAAELVVGQRAAAELTITNAGRRATGPVEVEDPGRRWRLSHPGLSARPGGRPTVEAADTARGFRRFVGEKRILGDPLRLPGLRPGEQAVVAVPIPTSARGLLSLSPLRVWCEDPLRLVARRAAASPPTHVLVCPSPERATTSESAPAVGGASRPYDSDEHEAARTQGGDEFRGLRPYVPGDRMTRLHWPVFSRTGNLTVRDFVESVSGRVTILVDLRPSAHADRAEVGPSFEVSGGRSSTSRRSIETVVSRAAGLELRALERGKVVELCTSAGERLEIPPGPMARHDLLCALAVVGSVSGSRSSSVLFDQGPADRALWAASNGELADVLLVTTGSGQSSALPDGLSGRVERVVVG